MGEHCTASSGRYGGTVIAPRLGLGTVQFGIHYGIANEAGRCPEDEVERILARAASAGVRTLDTGPGYGCSEEVLGRLLCPNHSFRIVTKTPHSSGETIAGSPAENLDATFRRSLARLKAKQLDGLLFHRSADLFSREGPGLIAAAQRLKAEGLIEKLGVSVYSVNEIDELLELSSWDLIQLPVNVLDQRILESGILPKLKSKGIEIHARSVLLQGALGMPPERIEGHLEPLKENIFAFQNKMKLLGLTAAQGALSFVLGIPEIDVVLIGVDSEAQLIEYLQVQPSDQVNAFSEFKAEDPALLNPALWPVREKGGTRS